MGGWGKDGQVTDLSRCYNQCVPVYSRQDVDEEFGIQLDGVLD